MIALDASALLAFLLRERGHERVRELLSEACMLQQATGAAVLMHEADLPLYRNLAVQAAWVGIPVPGVVEVDQFLKEGDVLRCASLALEVLPTKEPV